MLHKTNLQLVLACACAGVPHANAVVCAARYCNVARGVELNISNLLCVALLLSKECGGPRHENTSRGDVSQANVA